jgi:hypothetical protein
MGGSESLLEAPKAISTVSVAKEHFILLKNAGIAPLFLVMCHSGRKIATKQSSSPWIKVYRRDDICRCEPKEYLL